MMRESESVAAREAAAEEELAAKLDTLSRPLAERILGRAIELQHEAENAEAAKADRIDYEDLKAIALEVGIPEDALKRALREELETERDQGASTVEKLTAPKHVRGGTVVEGDRSVIEQRLRDYLERVEGLELDGERRSQLAWAERHPRSGRKDRVMESITTDQEKKDRHLVELDFNTLAGRKRARRLALLAVILGTIFGGAIGGLAIFGGIMVGITAGVVGAVSWMRRLARKARGQINGALEAAANDGGRTDGVRSWLDIWEAQQRR
jgi:hypothetical protein